MSTQRYSVTPHSIETLLTWVKTGEIAIPEIQRPFVWDAKKVRNLLDSLYQGYPVGYLIAWKNPTVRLKDGTKSLGKRILIDGQQRVTALMAAILGYEVLTKDYETIKIRIAFNPQDGEFQVSNSVIEKNPIWISDIAEIFKPSASIFKIVSEYCNLNQSLQQDDIFNNIERLRSMINNHVGIIDLADDLDIETVTEIFIRVNSAGVELSQADFVMSKIAVNEIYGGNVLRKAIEYFCHLAVMPDFASTIEKNDSEFTKTEYFSKMVWLKDVNDDLYDPTYTDLLRVAFTLEFSRGKLQDLVALLSGRNFETMQYEEAKAEESFAKLKRGVVTFMNKNNFEKFVMILSSAGFITSGLFGGQNAVNFAYIIYLKGRSLGLPQADIERLVSRWYAMSILRGRYAGSPESAFDLDIRQIDAQGLKQYVNSVIDTELPDSFWSGMLPQLMETSSAHSPYWLAFQAAQAKLDYFGFLSRDIRIRELLLHRCDVHHIYPKNYLKQQGFLRGKYNQIANYAITQTEINIAIKDNPPDVYFVRLANQCAGKSAKYGGITDEQLMRDNLRMHCIPEGMLDGNIPSFEDFLSERRKLMALKIKTWFEKL